MITELKEIKLYTDGGARGNPGPAACAYVICKVDENVVEKYGFYIGETTNNQAEYRALEAGLRKAVQLSVRVVNVYMDSELAIKQLKGEYKVKSPELRTVYQSVIEMLSNFQQVNFTHIPRELNKIADAEVNRVLDARG